MEIEIYLLRHGETELNARKLLQGGGVDPSLNAKGREQAEAFFQAYKDVPFKRIYTSALKRSMQSVQRFIDKGLPHESREELNEIHWGLYDGQFISKELFDSLIFAWNEGDFEARLEEGENVREVQKRQLPLIFDIIQRNESPILVCAHGRAIRILLATLIDRDLRKMQAYNHSNAGLYLLHLRENAWEIKLWNSTEHLS